MLSKADFGCNKKIIFQAGRASPRRERAQYDPDGNSNRKSNDDIGLGIPHALLNTAKRVNIQSDEG
jgi:hypothetical protein